MAVTETTNLKLQKIDAAEKVSSYPAVQAANMDRLDSAIASKAEAAELAEVDGRLTTVEAYVGSTVQAMEPDQVQAIVQSGNAARYFPVGTQLTVPWTYDGTRYDWVWDVVHHYDGSDDAHPLRLMADGTEKPAMCLMAHYCLPINTEYSPHEAFYVPGAEMAAGAYHFAVNVNAVWSGKAGSVGATVGTRQYQFSTTKAHPAGAQLMWNASYNDNVTSVTVYDKPMGTTASETCAVTETTSPTGTDLGTMSENESSAGLNNIERACEGNNRWLDSSMRLFLNSTDAAWGDTLVTKFHRRVSYDGKAGILSGFSEDFRGVLATVTNYTKPHAFDGDVIDETHDVLYPVSAREHAFQNYLGNTADGFNKEGVPLDYWTQLAKANGISSGTFTGWRTYPALITHDLADHNEARDCWERSAARYRGNAHVAGCVGSSGYVGYGSAGAGLRAVPAACIA